MHYKGLKQVIQKQVWGVEHNVDSHIKYLNFTEVLWQWNSEAIPILDFMSSWTEFYVAIAFTLY